MTIWLIPLIVTAVGMVLIAVSLRRVAEEAAALRRSTARLGELRPALVEVGDEVAVLRAALNRR